MLDVQGLCTNLQIIQNACIYYTDTKNNSSKWANFDSVGYMACLAKAQHPFKLGEAFLFVWQWGIHASLYFTYLLSTTALPVVFCCAGGLIVEAISPEPTFADSAQQRDLCTWCAREAKLQVLSSCIYTVYERMWTHGTAVELTRWGSPQ